MAKRALVEYSMEYDIDQELAKQADEQDGVAAMAETDPLKVDFSKIDRLLANDIRTARKRLDEEEDECPTSTKGQVFQLPGSLFGWRWVFSDRSTYLQLTRFYSNPNGAGQPLADSGRNKQAVYLHLPDVDAFVKQWDEIRMEYLKSKS